MRLIHHLGSKSEIITSNDRDYLIAKFLELNNQWKGCPFSKLILEVDSNDPSKKSMSIEEFYAVLKAKMTGQVINGVLAGCLLESELKEVYEQYRQSITNSTSESDD